MISIIPHFISSSRSVSTTLCFSSLNSIKSFATEEEKKENKKNWNKKKYENNKTEIIERVRKYRQNNKKIINEKRKKYYNDNKTEILEKEKVKIKCNFCGCELNKGSLRQHQKTLKCMKFQEFIDLE